MSTPVSAAGDRLWRRAQEYIAGNQITAARITIESLLQREPRRYGARMLLASVILAEGRVREAAEHAIAVSQLLPDDADVVSTTAHCLLRIGEMVAARECLHRFDAQRTRDGRVLMGLAHAYQELGEHRAALELMDRAYANGYDNPDFRYYRSLQLMFNGRTADAEKELEACLRQGPTFGRASVTLARLRKQTPESNHLDYIRRQLAAVERGSEDHAAFEFAQFEELEDLGRYDEAFAALERGNAIMYACQSHDSAREDALFGALMAATPAPFFNAPSATPDGATPIFIVGLPRSGTTLLDRILDNHSQVVSTGERTDFPRQLRWVADCHGQELIDSSLIERMAQIDCAEVGRRYLHQTRWRIGDKPYFVDKLPQNYMLVGLIRRALPHAPILHMVRDPMDVCFSNYKAMFGKSYAYSYDLAAMAAQYGRYRRLMQHWHATLPGQVLDVSYNDLVTDPEATVRRISAHCGLAYEPDCIDTTRNKSAVNTLSSAQVRQPIHARTLGEWRRYARQLEPLRALLAPWLDA